ncbi:MAG: DNA modification methylase [Eubacteriaceae bacterium]|nr:DNA modification methylase [Eubacteriaceae bacterium]
MEFKKLQIESLIPASYNPRKKLKPGDTEFEKIKNSIKEFGYVDPVIVNQDLTVIGGHQRVSVLKSLGHMEIDCVIIDIDKTKEKALNIALNKAVGSWDEVLLADLLKDLEALDFDLKFTGFDPPEIDELFSNIYDKEIKEDDFDVDKELAEPAVTKLGDVWLLGKHRLICGDSTNSETLSILMNGEKANLCVTDPPYGVNFTAGSENERLIKNDNLKGKEFYEFLLAAFKNIYASLDDGGAIYVFHADTEGLNFRNAFMDAGFKLSSVCQWVKNSLVLGRSDYQWQNEPVLYGWKPTGSHRWYSDRKQTTIWNFDRPSRSKDHPTTKPLPLIAYPIKNSSMSNCIVLDPFGGSGSTLIASEQTGRICYTSELDEKYSDVIVKRFYQNFPETVIKRNGVVIDPEVLFCERAGEKSS